MNRKRMLGVFDPITLGFILTIVGSATVLSVDSPKSTAQVEKMTALEQVQTAQQIETQID